VHATRLGNDVLQYLCFAACSYHFARWYRFNHLIQLNLTLAWLGASFATKNSVIVLLLGLALLTLGKMRPYLNQTRFLSLVKGLSYARHVRPLRVGLLLLVLGISFSFGRNLLNAMDSSDFVFIGGMRQPKHEFVFAPEQLKFDLSSFLLHPYIYEKDGNDRYTLHMMLKSMTFAEYPWEGRAQAILLNGLMLSMWCFLIGSLICYGLRHKPLPRMTGFYATFFFCCVLALYLAKIYYMGIYIWADTRHLFAMIVYFLLAYLSLLDRLRHSNRTLYMLGCTLLSTYAYMALLHDGLQLIDMTTE
jgi:hypothetical protein